MQRVAKFWFGQWKHPRYKVAGTLHLLIFAGFLLLATRAFYLLLFGLAEDFLPSGGAGRVYDVVAGRVYGVVADYAGTIVFLAVPAATIRRLVYNPARYGVPERYGKSHPIDAIFLLSLIALLMLSESLFEATRAAIQFQQGQAPEFLPIFSMPWILKGVFGSTGSRPLTRPCPPRRATEASRDISCGLSAPTPVPRR